ncbi:MAG: hypothetical protein JOZ53_21205, partial [Planctomycetaceae bacterium]|nr:hypothetical protein [Planctomycetaceae bacterium]
MARSTEDASGSAWWAAGRARLSVQLDTVFVNLTPTKAIKHFTAYDPVAKWTVGKAFNRATAKAAASFLDK